MYNKLKLNMNLYKITGLTPRIASRPANNYKHFTERLKKYDKEAATGYLRSNSCMGHFPCLLSVEATSRGSWQAGGAHQDRGLVWRSSRCAESTSS